jgi:hypothetical protein
MSEDAKADVFGNAELYDCDEGAEVLSYESPSTAIERWLDGFMSPGCDAEAIIREHAPITVYAFEREKLSDKWADVAAEWAAERLEESWQDDHGGEDSPFTDEQRASLVAELTPIFDRFARLHPVWRCSKVAERTYSEDEVIAMMREDTCWFDDDKAKP